MSLTTIVILVELDDAADRPSGSASLPGGEPRAFHGWLGLAAAIQELSVADATDATPAPTTEGEPR